jgi:hypothetical protein
MDLDIPECITGFHTLEAIVIEEAKRPSERQLLAERIAKYIRQQKWTAPFGGECNKDGKAYSILFAKPRTLDGLVRVWGPKFILIECQGPAAHGNWRGCYESEEDAMKFLRLAFQEHKWTEAMEVPIRKFKETVA